MNSVSNNQILNIVYQKLRLVLLNDVLTELVIRDYKLSDVLHQTLITQNKNLT